ncbi:triosephosphate isomerase [Candidatus Curtissbacteria bacterium]|nr:triosephosphate isomerase [Candidatus Curtissbacteria bacterium]
MPRRSQSMLDNLPLIVANFKANKTWDEVASWIQSVAPKAQTFPGTVVISPSMPFISEASQKIKDQSLKIKLASQDISKFEQGAATGEVAASQIKDLAAYTLIGHSERRQNFGEDDKILALKVQNAISAHIEPIFCVQGGDSPVPQGVKIIAYEPLFAIGTGNPDDPANAKSMGQKLKTNGNYLVLYGGSVTAQNIKSFLKKGLLDGVLVGTASLDPQSFLKIIEAVSK